MYVCVCGVRVAARRAPGRGRRKEKETSSPDSLHCKTPPQKSKPPRQEPTITTAKQQGAAQRCGVPGVTGKSLRLPASGRHRGGGGGVMTLRLNNAVTRLLTRRHRRRPLPAIAARLARLARPFTVSALDTKRIAMEKSRSQIYAQWSQTELISRILELERSMET